PAKVYLRSHFLRLGILEDVGGRSNGHFFRLLKQTLGLVLIGVIHFQVRKHRLHVTRNPAILDTELRVNRELPLCHVKSAVSAKKWIEGPHVGVQDRYVHGEFRTLTTGQKGSLDRGQTASQKFTCEMETRRS